MIETATGTYRVRKLAHETWFVEKKTGYRQWRSLSGTYRRRREAAEAITTGEFRRQHSETAKGEAAR